MYTVLEYFTDLKDNNYAYKAGDLYPREGYKPSDERIDELSSNKNVRKRAIIAVITDNATTTEAETVAEVAVDNTVSEDIPAEKPKRRRKKAEE